MAAVDAALLRPAARPVPAVCFLAPPAAFRAGLGTAFSVAADAAPAALEVRIGRAALTGVFAMAAVTAATRPAGLQPCRSCSEAPLLNVAGPDAAAVVAETVPLFRSECLSGGLGAQDHARYV